MSNNPITTSGALAIIYAIKLNNSSILESLDLAVIYKIDSIIKENKKKYKFFFQIGNSSN